jgi:hypothetical protein
LPMLETTPPVTKTNFVLWLLEGAVEGTETQRLVQFSCRSHGQLHLSEGTCHSSGRFGFSPSSLRCRFTGGGRLGASTAAPNLPPCTHDSHPHAIRQTPVALTRVEWGAGGTRSGECAKGLRIVGRADP